MMKIILDTDGTTTNFNKFMQEEAIPYFQKKYGMEIVNPEELEVEDILDMKNFFQKKYSITEQEAEKMVKKALDSFWIGWNFVKFSLLNRFRPGVKEFLNKMIKLGYDVEIHTSRSKTCDKTIIGKVARTFTIWQYWLNGVKINKKDFFFYKNDEDKINGIIDQNPDLVFDDKPIIIDQLLNKKIPTICVEGNHNKDLIENKNMAKINTFNQQELDPKLEKLIPEQKRKYHQRIVDSNRYFKNLQIFRPAILGYFRPLVLHKENIIVSKEPKTIIAPNHRNTFDPLVITGFLNINVHWAALSRFFEANDSIFNNSKNIHLCKFTADAFKKLEYFPIERKCDNPNANNFNTLKDMNNFLKYHEPIGIFGEGTTKHPENQYFGNFDDSFLTLAKKNNAWIQPVTITWVDDNLIGNKVVINFGKAFKVNDQSIEKAMEKYMTIHFENLKENEDIIEGKKKNKKKR